MEGGCWLSLSIFCRIFLVRPAVDVDTVLLYDLFQPCNCICCKYKVVFYCEGVNLIFVNIFVSHKSAKGGALFSFIIQRYYWFKKQNPIWTDKRPFPMDVIYTIRDTIEILRPKAKIFESWEEACGAAEELDKEFRAKLGEYSSKCVRIKELKVKLGEDSSEYVRIKELRVKVGYK